MVGKKASLTALVSQKKRKKILEQLCAKNIGLKNVKQDVIGILNNMHSKVLSHCQFKALVGEMDAQYGDVLYRQEVR